MHAHARCWIRSCACARSSLARALQAGACAKHAPATTLAKHARQQLPWRHAGWVRGKPKPGSHDAGLLADTGLLGDAWRLADTGTGAPVPWFRPRRLCRTLCRRRRRAQTQRYHAQTQLDLQEGGLHRSGGTNLASRSVRDVCGLESSSVSIATSTGMPHASIQSSRSTLRTPAG